MKFSKRRNQTAALPKALLALSLAFLSPHTGQTAALIVLEGKSTSGIPTEGQDGSSPAILGTTSDVNFPGFFLTAGDSTELVFHVSQAGGGAIVVQPLAIDAGTNFIFRINYSAAGDTGLSFLDSNPVVLFTDLVGTAPTFTSFSSFSFGSGTTTVSVDLTASLSDSFAFTGVQFSFLLAGAGSATKLLLNGTPEFLLQEQGYFDGGENTAAQKLSFSVIPEPSAGVLLLGGIALLIGLQRRRAYWTNHSKESPAARSGA